jgi:hypothetical protein
LLVFRMAHKPAEEGMESLNERQLRLCWSHAKGDWPYQRRHKSAAAGSPFERAWSGEPVDELGQVGPVLADDPGPVSISARRYGDSVLALIEPELRAAER